MAKGTGEWIRQALWLSVALNGLFLGLFFYFFLREHHVSLAFAPAVHQKASPPPFDLSSLEKLSFGQIVPLLERTENVGEGYTVRDFALGALVAWHDLDIWRALEKPHLSERRWQTPSGFWVLFPGLKEGDFEKILLFLRTQKYPQTLKGMFRQVEKQPVEAGDPELLLYLCHTTEYLVFESLFLHAEVPLQRKEILQLALEGGWELLSAYVAAQKNGSDFSPSVRRLWLKQYMAAGSQQAVHLLLALDFSYAVSQLSDAEVIQVLEKSLAPTPLTMRYAETIARSVRSDAAIACAAKKLALWQGDALAARFDPRPSLGELRPAFRDVPPPSLPPRVHVVSPGESLWMLSQRYQVPVGVLMEANGLSSPHIRAGQTLKIPPL